VTVTTSVDLSTELRDWIRFAGLDLIQGSQTDDGRTVIWNKGGEIRYFIDFVDGYYVITSSDRMDTEKFHFGAVTMILLEKYLCGRFGGSVRRIRGLRRVRKPFSLEELQHGCTIGKRMFAARERATLIDSTGTVVAIGAVDRLVELSHYIDVTVDTIKDSFLDPEGTPLFSPLTLQ
jgi:Immunity protein 61